MATPRRWSSPQTPIIILSILPPANALAQASDVAHAMQASGCRPVYVDCNAISPRTAQDVADVITGAGAPFIDGASVTATVKAHGKGDKVMIQKFKRRQGYRRLKGHRQQYSEIEITSIQG